jgi:hypothetical protein
MKKKNMSFFITSFLDSIIQSCFSFSQQRKQLEFQQQGWVGGVEGRNINSNSNSSHVRLENAVFSRSQDLMCVTEIEFANPDK